MLDNFSQISGLKVNYSKSELALLGRSRMEIYTHNFSPGMEMTLDKIKALGVNLPTNGKNEDLIKLNFEEKKQKIKDSVHSWSKRSLTLLGKVTIIKSLIIPQITYLLSILPNPEISYFKEIDKVIFSFLWDNKPPKLSRTMVLRKIAFGRLNVPDIYAYSKSVKFHWLQKVLNVPLKVLGKVQLRFPVLGNNFIFNCNLKPKNIENVPIKNTFWRDLLKYFFELRSKTTEPLQGDSIIWFNSLLKIEGDIILQGIT